jgi:CheY-like chemotaxis protein
MDGIEAVRIIRNEIDSEYARTVPIVALTANALLGNADRFLQNGFQALISKPVDTAVLDDLLNRLIRDKQDNETLRQAELAKRIMESAAREKTADSSVLNTLRGKRINGIDFEAGVQRFGGSEEAYIPLLRAYMERIPSLLDDIRDVWKISLPEYAIKVHGLKGASYGIGANELGRMAEVLEAAAKADDYPLVMEHHDLFLSRLNAALNGIFFCCRKWRKIRRTPASRTRMCQTGNCSPSCLTLAAILATIASGARWTRWGPMCTIQTPIWCDGCGNRRIIWNTTPYVRVWQRFWRDSPRWLPTRRICGPCEHGLSAFPKGRHTLVERNAILYSSYQFNRLLNFAAACCKIDQLCSSSYPHPQQFQ